MLSELSKGLRSGNSLDIEVCLWTLVTVNASNVSLLQGVITVEKELCSFYSIKVFSALLVVIWNLVQAEITRMFNVAPKIVHPGIIGLHSLVF